jgi:hypothetical protein
MLYYNVVKMKKVYKFLIAALFAITIGGAIGNFSVNPALNVVNNWSNIKNGPWSTNLSIGSPDANPYVKAWVAENGLMALNRSETIYLDAYSDDNGGTLKGDSDYTIHGAAPDARWWDITVYDQEGFLINNDQNRYSYSSSGILYETDGSIKIYLSRTPKQGNWLPAGNAKEMSLYLRLHNPGSTYLDPKTLQTADLPHISMESSQ